MLSFSRFQNDQRQIELSQVEDALKNRIETSAGTTDVGRGRVFFRTLTVSVKRVLVIGLLLLPLRKLKWVAVLVHFRLVAEGVLSAAERCDLGTFSSERADIIKE